MLPCFFASDLHGKKVRYQALLAAIAREKPAAVFLGGDLLPSPHAPDWCADFVSARLARSFERLAKQLGARRPRVFVILGNDDPRSEEQAVLDAARRGTWEYLHLRRTTLYDHPVFGYQMVPPTPFLLKDWERYDVSRFVDPGAVSPEEGLRSVDVPPEESRWATIAKDLAALVGDEPLDRAVILFHCPPYQTKLDRAALDGRCEDGVPLDVNVGSIAVRRLIEERGPLLTLHGHIHESARLTGSFQDQIGRTVLLGAAHDGPELSLVRFDPDDPSRATRELLAPDAFAQAPW